MELAVNSLDTTYVSCYELYNAVGLTFSHLKQKVTKIVIREKSWITDNQVVKIKTKVPTGTIGVKERYKLVDDYAMTEKFIDALALSFTGEKGDKLRKSAAELFAKFKEAKLQDEAALSMNERTIVALQNQLATLESRIANAENRINAASEWAKDQMKKDAIMDKQIQMLSQMISVPQQSEPRKNTLAQICKAIKMKLADAKKKLESVRIDPKYFVTKTDKYGEYIEFTLEGIKWLKAFLKNSGENSLIKKEAPKWMNVAELATELNVPQTAIVEYLYKKGVISSTKTLKITPFGMRNYYAKYFGETLIVSPEFIAIMKRAF